MKRYLQHLVFSSMILGISLSGMAGMARASDVCSRGIGEPPFLSYGVKSNLLMLLDNSGSMLDMGYVDPDTQCSDDTFTPCDPTNPEATCYAGNYELTMPTDPDDPDDPNDAVDPTPLKSWYKWVFGVPQWDHGDYVVGDIVYADGALYRAKTSGPSTGLYFAQSSGVLWEPVLRPAWQPNHHYHAHSFVFDLDRGQVFYSAADHVSPAAPIDPDFTLVQKWQSGVAYPPDTYVMGFDQRLYYTIDGGTSTGDYVTNDQGVVWYEKDFHGWRQGIDYYAGDIVTQDGMVFTAEADHPATGLSIYEDNFSANWRRLDEGYFEQVTEADARTVCSTAAGTGTVLEYHSSGDVCLTVDKIILDASVTPNIYFGKVAAFAASGNLLNWASSSKFDIQKDILTGGKFNSDAQRLVSENRGCAGARFVKQVPLDQGTTADPSDDMILTFTVRSAGDNDRVDLGDDTTRLEIYAVTPNGFDDTACQEAVEMYEDPGGQGPTEQLVTDCLGYTVSGVGNVPVEHILYHKAMQECWYWVKHDYTWKPGGDYLLTGRSCETMYLGGQYPANIIAEDTYYVCYGIYDGGAHHQREGFVGRCWEPGPPVETGDCQQKTCVRDCGNSICYFEDGGSWYRCNSDNTLDICSGNFNDKQMACNKPWLDIWEDVNTKLPCVPVAEPDLGGWSDNLDGNDGVDSPPEPDLNAVTDLCIDLAMQDFCLRLTLPEVIDPSDQASDTDDLWGLPLNLIDAGVVGQLGPKPLFVTKGYVQRTSPPEGILHETVQDLRIGAMAFNANGADFECEGVSVTDQIVQYCPMINQDGAHIISPIRLGGLVTDDNGTVDDETDDTRHLDDLVTAINAVRATSWTPLAEAMYNAVGYYTQNDEVRLYNTDFQIDADVGAWQNNVEYGSGFFSEYDGRMYQTVSAGRSDGSTPLDDTGIEWREAGVLRGDWGDSIVYNPRDIVKSTVDNKYYITYFGGTSNLKLLAPENSPLYDKDVAWEPLIDPVANWCQDNNVLIITEGASTADINPDVAKFVMGTHDFNTTAIADPDVTADDPAAQCADGLEGSTYLDDVTYFAFDANDEFTVYPDDPDNSKLPIGDYPYTLEDKKNITTYIVVAGSLREDPAPDECDPATLMTSAAVNGGTEGYIPGENPSELREKLLELFNALRQRASAGSAASVISSARGGEGAIYQAIFWPELLQEDDQNVEQTVAWAGDVHGLFLDNRGYMFEDRRDAAGVGDRTLIPCEDIDGDGNLDVEEKLGEDIDGDGHYDCVNEDTISVNPAVGPDGNLDVDEDIDADGKLDCGEDLNCNGVLDVGEDVDGDSILDLTEDLNGNGAFDPGEDLDGDGHFDNVHEDVDRDGWLDINEDLDGDGKLDCGEDINCSGGDPDPGEDIDGDGTLDLSEDLDGEGCGDPWGPDGIRGTADDLFDPFVDVDGDGYQDVDEDLDNDGVLDCGTDTDRRVIIYFDDVDGRSKVCYNTSIFRQGSCDDGAEMYEVNFVWAAQEWLGDYNRHTGGAKPQLLTGQNRAYQSTEHGRYIFTWNDLNNDSIADADEIRPFDDTFFTGIAAVASDRGAVVNDFDLTAQAEVEKLIAWMRGLDQTLDEDLDDDGVLDAGEDINGNGILDLPLRGRELPLPLHPAVNDTWRLGDIIHSTPMTVAAPAEGYHLIYNDFSYAQFLDKYKERRHVVYFGANDGMLHAVNAGFYNEQTRTFCLTPDKDSDGSCTDSESDGTNGAQTPFELGTELWAYVPYNLQPHLKCLADPEYGHKYYVDQRPRIFDVQIFNEEPECATDLKAAGCIHPNGWGTLLVGGMRFGGAPITAPSLNGRDGSAAGVPEDERLFVSSFFFLDITDPENPPTLLGELTRRTDGSTADLGFTSAMPTMVIMKEIDYDKWYLVFGSGPHEGWDTLSATAVKGVSDQAPRVSVLPLDWMVDRTATVTDASGNVILPPAAGLAPLRIPAVEPGTPDPVSGATENEAGTFTLPSLWPGGFVSDLITVDYDINPSYEAYKSDVVYFGTVEGHFSTLPDGSTYWDGGGRLHRLVTKEIAAIPELGRNASPYGRGTTENTTIPAQWEPKVLLDLSGRYKPITAAASVGTDGYHFWVYFGTGRFYDADDKTDLLIQSYYGIKEPSLMVKDASDGCVDETRYLLWDEVEIGANPPAVPASREPGERGLLNVERILVGQSSRIEQSALTCKNIATGYPVSGDYSCLPFPINNADDAYLNRLDRYIGGTGLQVVNHFGTPINRSDCTPVALPDDDNLVDGWYKNFHPYYNRERNVGQATLLGGLVTYTTYQPFNDVCQAEGNAFLYAEYYRTGTAWHKNIFGLPEGIDTSNNVVDKLDLGRGLATTPNLHVGSGEGVGDDDGPKAFVQTSTGEIKEIKQENLPINNYRTGRSKWKEYNP